MQGAVKRTMQFPNESQYDEKWSKYCVLRGSSVIAPSRGDGSHSCIISTRLINENQYARVVVTKYYSAPVRINVLE